MDVISSPSAPGRHPTAAQAEMSPEEGAARGGPRRGLRLRRVREGVKAASGLPWILPALLLCVGLIYYCIGYTGYISSLNWDGISPNPASVGFGNYTAIFHDPLFWGALEHTGIFFAGTFVAQTALGLIFAVLLHSKVRLAGLYKVIVFVPVVIAPAIMAPVFREMLSPTGQVDQVLRHIGLGMLAQPWIGQTSTALPSIMAITVWEWTGFSFVLYYAAISQIDESVVEAARLDGAGNLTVIRRIVWPSVAGTTVALGTLSAIGALKTFDIPWLINQAGPDYATNFLGTYIYQMVIQLDHVGYAAALSILLLFVAVVFGVVLQSGWRNRKVMQ
ncbi:MAG: sugar ABC transporter permease [Actinomycetota bacterium]|nr:sugar ABC transporter permease [Actinomycetota bacterium]